VSLYTDSFLTSIVRIAGSWGMGRISFSLYIDIGLLVGPDVEALELGAARWVGSSGLDCRIAAGCRK
jgi:hypothetical protein